MCADFIENIMIPKSEYLSLKEKVEKTILSEKAKMGDETNGGHSVATEDIDKSHESKGLTQSGALKLVAPDTNTPEGDKCLESSTVGTRRVDKHTPDGGEQDKEGGQAADLSRRQIDSDDKVASTQSTSDKPPPIDPAQDDKEDPIQRFHVDNNDASNEAINKSKVDTLMGKVPTSLKRPVRTLVDYIVDNGNGIIEWDDSFRFLYMKQLMPRTNMVRLLCHSVEPKDRVPKAASVFLRALKSLGIDNPIAYVNKHAHSKSNARSVSKKKNNDNAAASTRSPSYVENVPSEDNHMNDMPDGMETKKGSVPKTRKRNKFENLSGKWQVW